MAKLQDKIRAIQDLGDDALFSGAYEAVARIKQHIQGDVRVDDWDELEVLKRFVAEASKRSIYFFGKAVLGFDKFTKETHKRWSDDLQNAWIKHTKIGRLKPRGTFKTTLYGETFLLWIWSCVSPKVRFVYTSANQDLLDEVAAHLDTFLDFDSDSVFAFVFDIRRDPKAKKNTNNTFNITGRDKYAKGNSLMLRTAGGSTNGLHPHFIIVDDPMDKKDRESEAVRKQKERWYDSLHPLLVPLSVVHQGREVEIRHIMVISTRWHLADLIAHIKKQDEEFEFEEESVYLEGYDDDGQRQLRYPELLTRSRIEALRKSMSEVFFACQYMNEPLPEGVQLFGLKKLRFIKPENFAVLDGSNYCFLDPAKGTESGAYPAVVFTNRYNGRNVFFDAIDEKLALDAIISLAVKKCSIHKVRLFVFESNGTTLLRQSILRALSEIQYQCAVVEINETRNKQERIASMQPDLIWGDNYFMTDYDARYPELMKQLTLYPAYGPVDFPDVIEKAISYIAKRAPGKFDNGAASGTATGKPQGSGTITGSLKDRSGW